MNINYLSRTLSPPLTLRLYSNPVSKPDQLFCFSNPASIALSAGTRSSLNPRSVWVCKGRNLFCYSKFIFKFFFTPVDTPQTPNTRTENQPRKLNEQPPPLKRDAKVRTFLLKPNNKPEIMAIIKL
jgi:hypothetical protein